MAPHSSPTTSYLVTRKKKMQAYTLCRRLSSPTTLSSGQAHCLPRLTSLNTKRHCICHYMLKKKYFFLCSNHMYAYIWMYMLQYVYSIHMQDILYIYVYSIYTVSTGISTVCNWICTTHITKCILYVCCMCVHRPDTRRPLAPASTASWLVRFS